VLAVEYCMTIVDLTIVNVALPTIGHDLKSSRNLLPASTAPSTAIAIRSSLFRFCGTWALRGSPTAHASTGQL
jgi:hypothetical protein